MPTPGLEPGHREATDPKSVVSTNSTTSAFIKPTSLTPRLSTFHAVAKRRKNKQRRADHSARRRQYQRAVLVAADAHRLNPVALRLHVVNRERNHVARFQIAQCRLQLGRRANRAPRPWIHDFSDDIAIDQLAA